MHVFTVQRRRRTFSVCDDFEKYSDVSENELYQIYKETITADTDVNNGGFLTPNFFRRGFIGVLSSRGLPVQCWRVSNCLQRLDPLGTALRWQYDGNS